MKILYEPTEFKDMSMRGFSYALTNIWYLPEILIGFGIFLIIIVILHFTGFFQSKYIADTSEKRHLMSRNTSTSMNSSHYRSTNNSSPITHNNANNNNGQDSRQNKNWNKKIINVKNIPGNTQNKCNSLSSNSRQVIVSNDNSPTTTIS